MYRLTTTLSGGETALIVVTLVDAPRPAMAPVATTAATSEIAAAQMRSFREIIGSFPVGFAARPISGNSPGSSGPPSLALTERTPVPLRVRYGPHRPRAIAPRQRGGPAMCRTSASVM